MSKQYTIPEPSEEQHKTRERIIAAASKVLTEKRYDATTMRYLIAMATSIAHQVLELFFALLLA